MRTPTIRTERGIALAVALVALVVIGGIVAGTFFISSMEQKTAENTVEAALAQQAAEAGIQHTVANWQTSYHALATNASATLARDSVAPGSYFDVTISRLGWNFFQVKSVGTRGGSTQTLAVVLRFIQANPNLGAALTGRSSTSIAGNATVTGNNTNPPNWTGCAASANVAGARSNTAITRGGSAQLSGSPDSIPNDPQVTTATFQSPYTELLSKVTLTRAGGDLRGIAFAPTTSGSPAACNAANQNNWGEPWRQPTPGTVTQCTGYTPVVLLTASSQMDQGRGQGVLLVNGNLTLSGPFEWTGLVIVTGTLTTSGNGAKITGAAMAQGGYSISGTPTITYSRCAVDYVLNNTGSVRPVNGRAWNQMF